MKRISLFLLSLIFSLAVGAQAAPEISAVSLAADVKTPLLIYGSGFGGMDTQAAFYEAAWEGKADDKEETARREASLKRYLAGKPEMKAPAALRWSKVMAGDTNTVAAVTPLEGPHLVQLRAGKEDSRPFILNRPEIWGISPRSSRPGDVLTVWGPNLGESFYLTDGSGKTFFLPGQRAYNYHSSRPEGRFVKLLDLPDDLAPGGYRLYSHWGRSDAGWSRGMSLTVLSPEAARPLLRVRETGALGDGQTDDTEAIRKAVARMAEAGGGTVFFDAGRYIVSGTIDVPGGVGLAGVSREASVLEGSRHGLFKYSERYPCLVRLQRGSSLEAMTLDLTYARGAIADNGSLVVVQGGKGSGPEIRNCDLRAEMNARYAGYPGRFVNGVQVADRTEGLVLESCRITVTGAAFECSTPAFTEAHRIRFNTFRQNSPHSHASMFNIQAHRESLIEGNIWENTGRGVTHQSRTVAAIRHNLFMHNILRNIRKSDGEIIFYETGSVAWYGRPVSAGAAGVVLPPDADLKKLSNPSFSSPGNLLPQSTLFISEGRGMGQLREITAAEGNTLGLDRPWEVQPDASSMLLLISGGAIENLHVGNEYHDCHQWVGVYGLGIRNAWVGDTYERVTGGLTLWKIGGFRQMSLNLAYRNKMHQRAGISVVNQHQGEGADEGRMEVFGNELRNNSIDERAYVSTENGQDAPRLKRQMAYGTSNTLLPMPGREPAIGILDASHPVVEPLDEELPISTAWTLIVNNQLTRSAVGIETSKAVARTVISGNLMADIERPLHDRGRDTVETGNTVYKAGLPVEK